MKKLAVTAIALFGLSAFAGPTGGVHVSKATSQAGIMATIAGINSGKIQVSGCGGNQKVYAYSTNSGAGSYVRSANGSFRSKGAGTSFKVQCRE